MCEKLVPNSCIVQLPLSVKLFLNIQAPTSNSGKLFYTNIYVPTYEKAVLNWRIPANVSDSPPELTEYRHMTS